jgi:F-type H+-transporting ATPase subunit delta
MPESRDINAEDARVAAQMHSDVGVERVADVYAKALLDSAEKQGQSEAVLEEFGALIDEVLNAHPALDSILTSALISHDEKSGILDRILKPQVSPLMLNFLKVVSNHGRLDCLRAIHHQARDLFDTMRGRVRVRLTTAEPIDDALVGQLMERLRTVAGGEPVLERVVDPSLIGGAVLRVGDTVHDGSIANQLENLRQHISDRSAHEIQSRRDRFRNTTGN